MLKRSNSRPTYSALALATCLAAAPNLSHAASETILYAFNSQRNGVPFDKPTHFGRGFYGTTTFGTGTVFFVDATGHHNVRHVFSGYPSGGLVEVNGVFYGVTQFGGGNSCGCGIIYSITPAGHFTQLYTFQGGKDGSQPTQTLLYQNGLLYGVTLAGGAGNDGTVFSVSPQGVLTTLYAFNANSDGTEPNILTGDGTTLYGSTSRGADMGCKPYGCGTIFKIDPHGHETTLYAFHSGKSGANSYGPLVKVGNQLYGTTASGGEKSYGTVFRVSVINGRYNVLYSFSGADGGEPFAGLTYAGGVFFGTTLVGGDYHFGTVFEITKAGSLSVLYSFQGGADGSFPATGLLAYRGTLYGTTGSGGGKKSCLNNQGCGTLYAITP